LLEVDQCFSLAHVEIALVGVGFHQDQGL
jgi:hypothetical protein